MVIPFRTISNIINLTSNALRGVYSAVSIQDRLQQQAERQARNEAQNNALATSTQPVKTNLVLDPQVVKLFMQKQEFDRELLEIKQKELELKEFQFEAYLKVETARDEREQERNKIERRKAEILEAKRRDEIELSKLHRGLMRELQRQEIEQRKNEVEANWDQVNWFSSLSKEETKEILVKNQESPRLLVLLAPLSIAASCPFQEDLPDELEHELRIFLRENYSLDDDFRPVQFYGGYFKRPITDAELDKLKLVLSPVSTVIIQTKITSSKVLINVGFWDFQSNNVLHIPIKPWNWLQMKESLAEEGISENKQNILVQEFITSLHKVLCAYITDAYYLSLDPYYEPQLFNLQDEFSQIDETGDFLEFYLQSLQNNRQEKIAVYEREIKMQQQKQVWNYVNSFTGFADSLYSIKINPNGKTLLGHKQGLTKLWDLPTGKLLQTFNQSCKYSPDGQIIISQNKGFIKVFDAIKGKLLYTRTGKFIVFANKGSSLLLQFNEDTFKLWNSYTGELIFFISGKFVGQTPKNILFARFINNNNTIESYCSQTGKLLLSIPGNFIGFCPKTNKFIVFEGNKIYVCNFDKAEKFESRHHHNIFIKFLPFTTKFIVQEVDNFSIYDYEMPEKISMPKIVLNYPSSCSKVFSPDSKYVIVFSNTEPIFQLFNLQTYSLIQTVNYKDRAYWFQPTFNSNGDSFCYSNVGEGEDLKKIYVVDTKTAATKYTVASKKYAYSRQIFCSCDQLLVSAILDTDNILIEIWSLETGNLLSDCIIPTSIFSVSKYSSSDYKYVKIIDINQEQDLILIAYTYSSLLLAWNIKDNKLFWKIKIHENSDLCNDWDTKYNLEKRTIVCEFNSGITKKFDIETGEILIEEKLSWINHNQNLQIDIGEDYKTGYSNLLLSEINTKELLQILPGHSGSIQQIEFSQDGQTMVSVGGDLKIKVWQKEREALPDE